MYSKEFVFDRMLNVTSELFFSAEKRLFFDPLQPSGREAAHWLDLGCGNGAYLAKLREAYPAVRLTGIELDEGMYRCALQRQIPDAVLYLGSYEQLEGNPLYDAVIARLVALHISSRLHWGQWLQRHMNPGASLILMDVDDEQWHDNGRLPLFNALYRQARRRLRGKGAFLSVPDMLRLELETGRLAHHSTLTYAIHADELPVRRRLYDYMRLVTEYLLNGPISADREAELCAWFNDTQADMRVTMFGMRFILQ